MTFSNNYFIRKESDAFPLKQYAYEKLGGFPDSAQFSEDYTVELLDVLLKKYEVISNSYYFLTEEEGYTKEIYFRGLHCVFKIWIRTTGVRPHLRIRDYYTSVTDTILPFKELIDPFVYIEEEKTNIYAIIQNSSGLKLAPLDFKQDHVSIEDNYNDDFLPIYNKMKSDLSVKDSKGLFILHGCAGTGKSRMLVRLASEIKGKKVIFLPPNMVDILSSPSFLPFIMEHPNSVILIEEAEQVLTTRDNTSKSNAVSNLLNITDGILAEVLKTQILATFNYDYSKIDKALMRKGRLKLDYEFKPLTVTKSNSLLHKLGKKFVATEAMTLADIYNVDDENNYSKPEPKKIGF